METLLVFSAFIAVNAWKEVALRRSCFDSCGATTADHSSAFVAPRHRFSVALARCVVPRATRAEDHVLSPLPLARRVSDQARFAAALAILAAALAIDAARRCACAPSQAIVHDTFDSYAEGDQQRNGPVDRASERREASAVDALGAQQPEEIAAILRFAKALRR